MPLTLTIRNADRLDNGTASSLVLDGRGAIIGRAATADWCLPDPALVISSRHCEVRFADGRYELIDTSTNGTFLAGQSARLPGPHPIAQGDVFVIGQFEVVASLDEASAAAAVARAASPQAPEWKGWDAAGGGAAAAPPASASSWDAPPPSSAISGGGPMSQNWAAPPAAPAASASGWGAPQVPAAAPAATPAAGGWGAGAGAATPPTAGGWGASQPAAAAPPPAAPPSTSSAGWGSTAPAEPSPWNVTPETPATPASDWSSPPLPPAPPSADDIWGKFAQSNVVDWARGGFGTASSPPTPPSFASTPTPPAPAPAAAPPSSASWGAPAGAAPEAGPAGAPPPPAPPPTAAPPPAATGGASGMAGFAGAAGIDPGQLKRAEGEALGVAGDLLRRLVSGMVVMLEARARAKSQLGAQGTSLEFAGNNPLKFARTPEQALVQLLNPAERGFMPAEQAVEDAFKDLQAHQMATLKAMQGALRATLDRFSPNAIRARAESGGFMSKILPGARDAALWAAYEKEFSGVARGSDEAFMDMFAKEFRKAYEEAARQK